MGSSREKVRARFWIEAAMATLTSALFVLTLLWHDWLEPLGYEPDNGSGAAEWLIVAGLFVLSVALVVSARLEWRRRPLPQ